ncbi:MAG: ABC transporter ATP-binding protein, partial [Bryobacteraceae bacterium]
LIDDVLPARNWRLAAVAVTGYFISYVLRLVFQWAGNLLTFRAVQRMLFRIRLSMLDHLQRLSADYHEQTPIGGTMFRLEQDVDQVGEFGGVVFPASLRMVLMTTLITAGMLVLDWRLTCAVLPLLPVFILLRGHYRGRLQKSSDAVQRDAAGLSNFLQETLSGMSQIQLLSREKPESREFARLAATVVRARFTQRMSELHFSLYTTLVLAAGMTLVLGFGGWQVMAGSLSIGGLVAFYSYLTRLFEPLSGAVELYSRFQRVGASIRRIMEILDVVPSVQDREGAAPVQAAGAYQIRLSGVAFGYRPRSKVLNEVNLELRPGERVALAGSSGSGKSTIAKLITRLYDAGGGSVSLNGSDVRDLRIASLRSVISLVPQDPMLFHGTVRDNILCGNPKAGARELEEAARIAQVLPVIARLPLGWDHPLGPRGTGLSGGERQRVALARAILQQRPILILDEATSALDAATEQAVLDALAGTRRRQTFLIISHRLAAAQWADRVIVLRAGRVAEQGTHEQLLNRGELYPQLWRLDRSDPTGLDGSVASLAPEPSTSF